MKTKIMVRNKDGVTIGEAQAVFQSELPRQGDVISVELNQHECVDCTVNNVVWLQVNRDIEFVTHNPVLIVTLTG